MEKRISTIKGNEYASFIVKSFNFRKSMHIRHLLFFLRTSITGKDYSELDVSISLLLINLVISSLSASACTFDKR